MARFLLMASLVAGAAAATWKAQQMSRRAAADPAGEGPDMEDIGFGDFPDIKEIFVPRKDFGEATAVANRSVAEMARGGALSDRLRTDTPFSSSDVDVLDIKQQIPDALTLGSFTDGNYAYLTPRRHGDGRNGGVLMRLSLSDFSTVDTLDLQTIDPDLMNFQGGFAHGGYGYLVPTSISGWTISYDTRLGKVVRFSLSDFSLSSVQVLDLAQTDVNLKGFSGGFTDGVWGYMVPWYPATTAGRYQIYSGKVARFSLADFSTVQMLDLEAIDPDLKGFYKGFFSGGWGYLLKSRTYGSGDGKMVRFSVADFSTVEVLDLANTDAGLTGFFGGFTDGTWGYAVPYHSAVSSSFHGKVPRFRLDDFSTVQVLDLAAHDSSLTGFYDGFTDGTFGYVMGYYNGGYNKMVVRFSLADFSTVEVRDFAAEVGSDHLTAGGFVHGSNSYAVTVNAKVIRFDAQPAAQATPASTAATPSAGGAGAGASAVGDPHLQNIHGERFDLMKAGKHVLINIPRGVSAVKALLRVQVDARQLGGQCADMYFQDLNVTGSWAEAKRVGGYHYSVSQPDVWTPKWITFGKVGLKVVHGRTDSGLSYLNVYVKHLGQAGFAVGGLLGEDDHEDVITPAANCAKSMSLIEPGEGGHNAPSVLSFAEASLA